LCLEEEVKKPYILIYFDISRFLDYLSDQAHIYKH